jgi:hypothetical protein
LTTAPAATARDQERLAARHRIEPPSAAPDHLIHLGEAAPVPTGHRDYAIRLMVSPSPEAHRPLIAHARDGDTLGTAR